MWVTPWLSFVLGLIAFDKAAGASECLDSESSMYRCSFTGSTWLQLDRCTLENDDLENLQPCFEDFGLENIERLYLFTNNFTMIPDNLFSGPPNLDFVQLSNNELEEVQDGVFASSSLTWLDIGGAFNLTSLPEGLLSGLPSLRLLSLSSNGLPSVPEGLFSSLPSLESLSLSDNKLTTLPSGLFSSLTSLKSLSFDTNELVSLPPGIFDSLTSLSALVMGYNNFTSLPAGIFTPMTALNTLSLRGNPDLQCLPETPDSAGFIDFGIFEAPLNGTCECTPPEAILCDDGTTCQPGSDGYTCVTTPEYEVASCDDLSAAIDDETVTSITIVSDTIACDEYTRFRVRNTMTLKAMVTKVTFSNVAFKVLGALTVEPDVTFNGVTEVPKRGGALYVQLGTTVTFMGDVLFEANSVTRKGGAIHNKGSLVFEKDLTFMDNYVLMPENEAEKGGKGGAISNHVKGSIVVGGKLYMEQSRAMGSHTSLGGAIYNKGDITVADEVYFLDNIAEQGGAIVQTEHATMVFGAKATFVGNTCGKIFGGAIANFGGEMEFSDGAAFESNYADDVDGNGGLGGAIFNADGGAITFVGKTKFVSNTAWIGGAIFNSLEAISSPASTYEIPVINFPAEASDLIFDSNSALSGACDDIANFSDKEDCVAD